MQTTASISQLLLAKILDEIVERIAKKVAEGKKLSDQEVIILYLDQILKTTESRFNEVDKRLNEVDKRLESLFSEADKRLELRFNEVDKRFNEIDRKSVV